MPPKSDKITMSDTKDKPVDGDGLLDMESLLPNLPRKVQNLYKKIKNDKVNELVIFRRPVGKAIEKALDAFSGGAVEKFFKNTNYDSLFHLGIIVNKKYLFHKQENFELSTIPGGYAKFIKGKELELSPVSGFSDDLTIKRVFRDTRKLMGEKKFYGYSAFSNNCQKFVVKVMTAIGAKFDKDFVLQDLKKLSKKVPSFTKKMTTFFTDFARTARRVIGFGAEEEPKSIENEVVENDVIEPVEGKPKTSIVGRSVMIVDVKPY
tara:strand:- start:590 stop:1378 length:789 start_codon:yes stop_codon:yes gene_type:complete